MRVVTVDGWTKADPVVSYGVWGRSRNLFAKWSPGETLIILVAKEGVITATVSGDVQRSDLMVWDNDLFEWRMILHDVQSYDGPLGSQLNGEIRSALAIAYPGSYGFVLRNQAKVAYTAAHRIDALLRLHRQSTAGGRTRTTTGMKRS